MDPQNFLLLFLILFPCFSRSAAQIPNRIGQKKTHGSVLRMKHGGFSTGFDPSRVTQISWRPRAFVYRQFLSEEECNHMINLAKDKLEKSMVADNDSGQSLESEVRTSSGMFLNKAQDAIVAGIEARIAAWTFLPVENGESMQILHYENGQKYEPHFDYFHDKANQELGGHRIATVLMYLSDVQEGGETIFPNSEAKTTQQKGDKWSDCAKNGYAEPLQISIPYPQTLLGECFCFFCLYKFWMMKPMKGDALLFFSLHPDATTDPSSLHGSCPVIEGEKWSATKWIHVRSFDKLSSSEENNGCKDTNENCATWAAAGECQKNPRYMVGSEDEYGYCRKSCRVCEAQGKSGY